MGKIYLTRHKFKNKDDNFNITEGCQYYYWFLHFVYQNVQIKVKKLEHSKLRNPKKPEGVAFQSGHKHHAPKLLIHAQKLLQIVITYPVKE